MKEGQPFNAADAGEKHINEKTLEGTRKALEDVNSKMHGEGCQCFTCLRRVVSEANSYLNFSDPEGKYPRYATDGTYIWMEDAE